MISKYGIFCQVKESGNFTKTAELYGYSQSAVSQAVKSLEQEIGFTLLVRQKGDVHLSADGQLFWPYIQAIYNAEKALEQKKREMSGLQNSTIRLGTFTSVSRNLLPALMKSFKTIYPQVNFVLRQGEYTSIAQWLKDGSIDFGFVNQDAVSSVETRVLYVDEMTAVLPQDHPLAAKPCLSLSDLAAEPLILLDEGEYSTALKAFERENLSPNIAYEVYDDYTILAMVRRGLGISLLYEKAIAGFTDDLAVRPLIHAPTRPVALAWQNKETMPYAAQKFIEHIISNC